MWSDSSALPSPAKQFVPYLLLVLAVFLAYANIYDNALLFDDTLFISDNLLLRSWDTFGPLLHASTTDGAHISGGFYRPLQLVLYFLIYQVSGPDPFLYHLLNVVLHAVNACLVFLLGKRLGFNPWGSFAASLLWAVHPLHTEAITYISGTAEPLFTLFCLLGVLVLLPDFKPTRFFFALPLFYLGLMSKESAVVFPALVVSCIFLLKKDRLKPHGYVATWPLWVMAGLYTWWRMHAPGLDGPQTYYGYFGQKGFENLRDYADHFTYRVYTFLSTLPLYLKLLLFPTGLHMERSYPISRKLNLWVLGGFLLSLAATAQIIWGRGKRGLPLSWGLMWFAAAYFPNTGLLTPVNSQFLEHWIYLPTIGLFLGIAETICGTLRAVEWKNAKPAAVGLTTLAALLLAGRTIDQNFVWHDPFTFYGNIFKYHEPSARAHNNLGLAYVGKHDYSSAIVEFHRAIAINDTYAETRCNLALAILLLPDAEKLIPDAIDNLNRATEIDPKFARAWHALAMIYAHTGDLNKETEARQKEKMLIIGEPVQ